MPLGEIQIPNPSAKELGRMSFFASLKTGEEEDLQKDDHVADGEGGGRRREGEPGGAPETSPLPSPPLPTPARTHHVNPAEVSKL